MDNSSNDLIKLIDDDLTDIIGTLEWEEAYGDEETDVFHGRSMLEEFLGKYRNKAIDIIWTAIESGRIDSYISPIFLGAIGDIDDSDLYQKKLDILTHFLTSDSGHIRYGAIRGLVDIYPKDGLGPLQASADVEKDRILQHMIKQVMDRLVSQYTRSVYAKEIVPRRDPE